MNRDTAALRHFDFRNKALNKKLFNHNYFTYLNDIAKDTEFFF